MSDELWEKLSAVSPQFSAKAKLTADRQTHDSSLITFNMRG
jgi:hypothetical protein